MTSIKSVPAYVDEQEKRIRTLTEKGEEMYNSQRSQHCSRLDKAWRDIEDILSKVSDCSCDISSLRKLEEELSLSRDQYLMLSDRFSSFLSHTNTEHSIAEREDHVAKCNKYQIIMDRVFKQITELKMQAAETLSVCSAGSRYMLATQDNDSVTSNVSSVLLRKRMKAEAERARLEFVKKETDIRKQQAFVSEMEVKSRAVSDRKKAELEAELHLVEQQKEAAVAEAEVQALESADSQSRNSSLSKLSEPIDRVRFTEQYVNQHAKINADDVMESGNTDDRNKSVAPHNESCRTPSPLTLPDVKPTPFNLPKNNAQIPSIDSLHELEAAEPSVFNPGALPFIPRPAENVKENILTEVHSNSVVSDLTRFLLKKDLLLSRLTPYNDRPESFATWKASFSNIMRELRVSPSEEVDLLIKWLGPESTIYAHSIRASNAHNPARGLKRIWERLDDRFGSPELVECSLKTKLQSFPKLANKDHRKLYELLDILDEIQSVKEDPKYSTLFAYYDSSSGILPIVNKLPYGIQEKWTTRAAKYKRIYDVPFPPFTVFTDFVREISKVKNDPGFMYERSSEISMKREKGATKNASSFGNTVFSRKTNFDQRNEEHESLPQINKRDTEPHKWCPLHKTAHPLNKCKGFRSKPWSERKKFVKENGICFKCCQSTKHVARECKQEIKCLECGSDKHPSALHIVTGNSDSEQRPHGGERDEVDHNTSPKVTSSCTQICGGLFHGKSCAKIVLVEVYPEEQPQRAMKMYAILDDQSNRSLARSSFFDIWGIHDEPKEYSISSCTGFVQTSGRRASGYVVAALDGSESLRLPTLVECDQIPNVREEIPTPEVARHYAHLTNIMQQIPELDNNASIMLLIGRDLIEAHHVLDQRIGQRNTPYAQKLRLGWVLIGESCLNKVHKPDDIRANKTHVLKDGRSSIFKPCDNEFTVKEAVQGSSKEGHEFGASVFERTKHDEKQGLSVDDRKFLEIMDCTFQKNEDGNWVAPLPFRSPRRRLPNNRSQALQRARNLDANLRRDVLKRGHFVDFMQNIFDRKHAEEAPPLKQGKECWYLPIFGVYHPKKPSQIRGVFDSSARFDNVSLNDVLLPGPDMINSLLGVLLRFRKEPIAVTADIEQMFYCFVVSEEDRNFLRFFWYRNNDSDQEMIEYRMRVHVFGNNPSPAVATYGLRKTAQLGEIEFGKDVSDFVERNFYVDDGLISVPTVAEAIDLVKRTQQALDQGGRLRLHKIASNSLEVMDAFSSQDRAKDLKDIDLRVDSLPLQRTLGLCWNLEKDCFTFQVSSDKKPFTRRGILSTVNSLFDPLGFVAPVVIRGKLLLRELMSQSKGWDDSLPPDEESKWTAWHDSLHCLTNLEIPRTYVPTSLRGNKRTEVHVFSDASEKAIAAVAYLRVTHSTESSDIGFLLGKAKVAPSHGHTIPRLELCAALLATEIAETVCDNIDIPLDEVKFYSDSKVVLGYICNTSRRFHMYVSNRVDKILKISKSEQWNYVPTDLNPADCASRSLSAEKMATSPWILGPSCLPICNVDAQNYPLVNPNDDKELRPHVGIMKLDTVDTPSLGSHRFERFSSFTRLVKAIGLLKQVVRKKTFCISDEHKTPEEFRLAEKFIIKQEQQETFPSELSCLKKKAPLPKNSSIFNLNPFIDDEGLLRVGGRINRSSVEGNQRNPIILHSRSHLATLIVRHYHESVHHQGRHFTDGAIRAGGYWIIGGKRLISSLIQKCVICRKLRGKQEYQQMSDLPSDRLEPSPPFTFVGVDTFGHWTVVGRKTRGGFACNKRWAILFTCLTTRAIHIEVVEELSTSSFINALRRFVSIRGNVKEFRSDRGTNFIGSTDSLKIDAVNVEDSAVKKYLLNRGTVWIFNPPHASHMGGVWERMIGVARRILDSLLAGTAANNLTHDVLTTFLCEVCAIVNNRPLVPVSSDPENPTVLSPSILLTQKLDRDVGSFEQLDTKDMYRAQWKRVQFLANMFWNRWKSEYIQTLQMRRKWQDDRRDIKIGDIVLLRDKDVSRNNWPIGVVVNVFPSTDGKIRKVEIRIVKNGKPAVYTRPVTEIVLLLGD